MNNYEVLKDKQEIPEIINKVATKISSYIQSNNIEEITLIPILNGALFYTVDLVRNLKELFITNKINCKIQIESVRISSYINNSNEGTELICKDLELINAENKTVLIIDDVYDSGNTFYWLITQLSKLKAKTILSTVFVNKLCNHSNVYQPNFVGIELSENKYLVGYGMDNDGYDRELDTLSYISNSN